MKGIYEIKFSMKNGNAVEPSDTRRIIRPVTAAGFLSAVKWGNDYRDRGEFVTSVTLLQTEQL